MNSNLMQCDDSKLQLLLAASDHDAEHDPWMHHVEQCSQCQSRLRELAADDDQWQKAAEVLATDDDDVPCFRGEREATSSWDEAMVKQLLDPPSHPEMLGRLGRYEMERMIGSGGMGIVFKAFDTELNRVVAVKLLAPYLAARGSARKRFAREARAAAGVRDDHVVPIFNVESEHEPPFLVMQYVAGGSLQEKLDRDGPLEVAEVLRIGLQTAKGLAAAHAQGLIHRDVKPSNILLDEGVERALLTDFGLARAEDDACLTRSGFHPGTPHYMSPEQVRGEAIDGRSDLFGLGCVLYALCTGRSPFRADTSYAVMRRITDETPRSIRELNTNIPEWLEAIVMKLLSKSRDDRFESATEVAELLEGCLAHVQEPITTPLPVEAQSLVGLTGTRASSLNAGFRRRPPIGKFLAAAAFAFLMIFGTIIYLETNKGTIRIETNSETDVPIVIRRGDEVVEHLTVSRQGTTARLKAGNYVIEVEGEDTEFVIKGKEVSLQRGGNWLATISEIVAADESNGSPAAAPGVYEPGDHSFSHNRGIVDKVLPNWEVIISLKKPDSIRIGERLQVSRPNLESDQFWNFAWIEVVEMVTANEGIARARVVQTRREQNGNRFEWMPLQPGDHVTSPDKRSLEEAGMKPPGGVSLQEQRQSISPSADGPTRSLADAVTEYNSAHEFDEHPLVLHQQQYNFCNGHKNSSAPQRIPMATTPAARRSLADNHSRHLESLMQACRLRRIVNRKHHKPSASRLK